MTELDKTSTKNQVNLLGFSQSEFLLIAIFLLGLLLAIGLHLGSKNKATKTADLGACDLNLPTAPTDTERLYSEKSQSLARCDGQLNSLQTSQDNSKRIVVEQKNTIESLKLEKIALKKRIEEQPLLAAANEEGADAQEELGQLIALLKKNDLYTESALNSVEIIIQNNVLLSTEVEKKDELLNSCESGALAPSASSDKKYISSELTDDYTSLQEDNQECLARIANLKTKHSLDFPACWTIENGQPDYIFNVTTTNDGFEVEKSYSAERHARALKIPGAIELQGKSLNVDEFSSQANKIFSWSKERNCRHYVRVFDSEGTSSKTSEKRLRNIQTYFFVLKK
jgi:hypothetical protein